MAQAGYNLSFTGSGNVGIGTSTPAQALEVAGAAAPLTVGTAAQLRLSRPTTSGTKFANSFDLALSVDVMEHIVEDVEVFRNIHTSLKDGGMLLISTPSDQGGSDVHDDADGRRRC